MLASMPSDCSRESSEWSSEVVWDFVEAFDEVELAATARFRCARNSFPGRHRLARTSRCGIHDGIRIGEQLRDIIGFRTIVFGSGKRNQALRSGFMTIADVKRRMTEGTRGEHLPSRTPPDLPQQPWLQANPYRHQASQCHRIVTAWAVRCQSQAVRPSI